MTISTRLRGFRTRFIAEPTISPETFFQALGHVRRAARDEIERLIAWLDSTIDVDEDSAVDDGPCDGDPDSEPSLGSFDRMSDQIKAWQRAYGNFSEIDCELDECDDEPSLGAVEAAGVRGGQEHWAQGAGADQEGDAHEDDEEGYDREEDPADGPLQVNEDGDGNPDDEPLLGWTEQMHQGQGTWGSNGIEAEQGSAAAVDVSRAKARYGQSDRHYDNHDGMHVDAEQGFGVRKRLRNLSDCQKEIVKPRLDRDAVTLT